MSVFSDIVDGVQSQSGQTGSTNRKIIDDEADGVLETINLRMQNLMVEDREQVTIPASTNTVTLPKHVFKVIEMGEYDSTTDRIKVPWDEISLEQYHDYYAHHQSIPSWKGERRYAFHPPNNDGALVVAILPTTDEQITALVRCYMLLTSSNFHKVKNRYVLKSGIISRLPKWFPKAWQAARVDFNRELQQLKLVTGGIQPAIALRNSPSTEGHRRDVRFFTT